MIKISTIIDLILEGFLDFLVWYAGELSGPDIILIVSHQVSYYIILQLILILFPFIKRLLNYLFFPFRWIHVYFHITAAKEILNELEKKKEQEDLDPLLDSANLRASLISGLDIPDENPGLLLSLNRLEHAKRVVFAPSRFALIAFIAYLLVSPILLSNQIVSTQLGALIHLYFFIGIFSVLMPSINDYYFLFHTLLLEMNIPSKYFYMSIIVYIIVIFDTVWRTTDFFLSVLIGTIFFIAYLIGLFIIGYLGQIRKGKNSAIYWLPLKSLRELISKESEIDFLSIEDLDL
ncbi:hypothetical protein [Candidatus Hodarchaeum mangrovi]